MKTRLHFIAYLLLLPTWSGGAEISADVAGFRRDVKPLLRKYCVACHGPEKQKGKMRLDVIDPDVLAGEHFGKWEDVRETFNSGEMPPEDEPQPTEEERERMTRWMDAEFKKAKLYGSTQERGGVRRLTRYELQYALEDLLHFPVAREVGALPEESTSVETGLKNSSRMLMISGPHLEAYLNVILSVITRMKEIAVFKPFKVRADIENLDVNPPPILTSEGKKVKPPLAKVTRAGKGVVLDNGGYLDLRIPSVSKYKFLTTLLAKAESAGRVEVAMGFQHSEVDTRQVVVRLGALEVEPGEALREYVLESYPEDLTDEFTKGDRPFFLRITNRGTKGLYLEGYEYHGNVNKELTATLVPENLPSGKIDAHVRKAISSFLTRAFRRPPTEAEFEKYHGIYRRKVKEEAPAPALLGAYKEILCSPSFFYLGLRDSAGGVQAANFGLAERLAFFLWCSVPDRELLEAAADGTLTKPEALDSHVRRMLEDAKSRRWVERFTDQWLHTSQLGNVAVDRSYYPRFRDTLKPLMHQETYEAVDDVFRKGSPALELLKADHVFVNQALAAFYNLKGVRGDEFRKVGLTGNSNRGGLLTQGTFLIGNSDGMNSHAILRGVWLAEAILHDPPPDPPANVPPLDESIPGFDKMTLNQKLVVHRDKEGCRACHRKIDPWGIPFENFDASGAWREKVLVISQAKAELEKGKKGRKPVFEKSYAEIERAATLPDGEKVDGIESLKEYLVTHRRRDFAKGLVTRILAYALSRDIGFHDEDVVNRLIDQFEANQYSVPKLIGELVRTEPFLKGTKNHGR